MGILVMKFSGAWLFDGVIGRAMHRRCVCVLVVLFWTPGSKLCQQAMLLVQIWIDGVV